MTNRDAINLLEEVKMLDDTMYAYNPCYEEALNMAISALEQPEIIRCKDCKKCVIETLCNDYWCDGRKVWEDHYCGYAERRDG